MKSCIIFFSIFITLTTFAQTPSAKNSKNMKNFTIDSVAIAGVLNNVYLKGIYEGDVSLLGGIYYENTLLFGDVKGQPYFKTVAQYLDGVKNRQSPKDSGKP